MNSSSASAPKPPVAVKPATNATVQPVSAAEYRAATEGSAAPAVPTVDAAPLTDEQATNADATAVQVRSGDHVWQCYLLGFQGSQIACECMSCHCMQMVLSAF